MHSTDNAAASGIRGASEVTLARGATGRDSLSHDSWPRVCSVAELGRILVILHGASAPSDAMLKKWSAAGEFRACRSGLEEASPEDGAPHKRPPGRPGLQLLTDRAIARVQELWPQLAHTDPQAIFEEAVARTARQLASAIGPLVEDRAARPALPPGAAPDRDGAETAQWQRRIEDSLATLSEDVKSLRREMAQFLAMRNNLMTRLDEVVARSRDTLLAAGRQDGGAVDPIVQARRDRDMALNKSTMEQVLAAMERLEGSR